MRYKAKCLGTPTFHHLSTAIGCLLCQVLVEARHNPFERHNIALAGECLHGELVIESTLGMPIAELHLPDMQPGLATHAAFVLHNRSNKHFRHTPWLQDVADEYIAGMVSSQ